MTIEQLWGLDPEPDPTPLRKHTRRPEQEHADDWRLGQEQYERQLDRMGEAS